MASFVEFWRRGSSHDLKHFQGAGRWKDFAAWEAIGKRSLAMLRDAGLDTSRDDYTMLEWGPGGGSNMLALMPYCRKYYGVDVAEESLNECAIQAPTKFKGILIEDTVPVFQQEAWVDVFLSTACFQHFPNKDYTRDVLACLAHIARHKAFGLIQIRYGQPDRGRSYEEVFLSATTWSIAQFKDECRKAGFDVLFEPQIDAAVRYAYLILHRK